MIQIRALAADDWRQWRDMRLAALLDAPYAFTTRYDEWRDAAEERWRDRLALPGAICFLATVDDEPVGIAGGLTADTGAAELVSMWVAPPARGRGVADALIDAVAAWARGRGASVLRLEVASGNDSATAAYVRNGFARTADEPQRGACEFVMQRRLDEPS